MRRKLLFFGLLFGSLSFPFLGLGASVQTIQVEAQVGVSSPPSPSLPSSGGGNIETPPSLSLDKEPPLIFGISILKVTSFSALVAWETDKETKSYFYYGKSKDLNLRVELKKFAKTHAIELKNLSPSTLYYFKIQAVDKAGNFTFSPILSFKTLPLPDLVPPSPVLNFKAELKKDKVILSWENPKDKDLAKIIIVRSEERFLNSPYQGKLIFEGVAEEVEDLQIEQGKSYYYSAFALDFKGNFSSPALAKITLSKEKPVERTLLQALEEELYLREIFYNFQEKKFELKISPEPILRSFKIYALEDSPYSIALNFEKEIPLRIYLSFPKLGQLYLFNKKGKTFEIKLRAFSQEGKYKANLILEYQAGKRKIMTGELVVRPWGYIYEKLKNGKEVGISKASVYLYWFNPETKKFELWIAKEYGQDNPQFTDQNGKYAFIVPPGKYYLKVLKTSYYPFVSQPFEVKDLVVNLNIELKFIAKEEDFFPQELLKRKSLILLDILLGSLILIVVRSSRRRYVK